MKCYIWGHDDPLCCACVFILRWWLKGQVLLHTCLTITTKGPPVLASESLGTGSPKSLFQGWHTFFDTWEATVLFIAEESRGILQVLCHSVVRQNQPLTGQVWLYPKSERLPLQARGGTTINRLQKSTAKEKEKKTTEEFYIYEYTMGKKNTGTNDLPYWLVPMALKSTVYY